MSKVTSPVRYYPAGYGPVATGSDYRPFDIDVDFLEAWRAVRSHTLVDRLRLFELWQLVAQALKVPGNILEVGAWRGGSAALMALRAAHLDPGRTVFVADTFSGVVKASDKDSYYRGGEHADTSLAMVVQFLHNLELKNISLLPGVFPEQTAHRIADAEIALCHIDVDVYQSASDAFEWVWSRMPRGGIVVFDDYGFLGCEGVSRLVHEVQSRPGLVTIANANGHAVVVKTD